MNLNLKVANNYFKALSADQSKMQVEYNKLFEELCKEYGVAHPFQLEDQETAEFFREISDRWKTRKRELSK